MRNIDPYLTDSDNVVDNLANLVGASWTPNFDFLANITHLSSLKNTQMIWRILSVNVQQISNKERWNWRKNVHVHKPYYKVTEYKQYCPYLVKLTFIVIRFESSERGCGGCCCC